jgi:hypothetical protein
MGGWIDEWMDAKKIGSEEVLTFLRIDRSSRVVVGPSIHPMTTASSSRMVQQPPQSSSTATMTTRKDVVADYYAILGVGDTFQFIQKQQQQASNHNNKHHNQKKKRRY